MNIHRVHVENILYNFGITETCEDIYYGDSLKVTISMHTKWLLYKAQHCRYMYKYLPLHQK